MGVPAGQPVHARHRHAQGGRHDRRAPAEEPAAVRHAGARLIARALAAAALLAAPVSAETIRLATWNVELARRGPGLLLQEIADGDSPQIDAVVTGIAGSRADVLLLTSVDYDAGLAALDALAGRLEEAGAPYPHRLALRPNTGLASGLDLDGDGRRGGPGDAQGFGAFAGQGGMAILSRLPIDRAAVRDYSGFLWRDLPGALLPAVDGVPFPSAEAQAVQRLSTTGHWSVPLVLPSGARLTLLAWHATPPVFDGPEDRNGLRNHDEAAFWLRLLDGELPFPAPRTPFVLLGDANLDPADGDGRPEALRALLAHPKLRDPAPQSDRGAAAARTQGGSNARHAGRPERDTADWEDDGPGNLRVDYVLPSADLAVAGSGVEWPAADPTATGTAAAASRHALVWVDVALP